ncbi:MAG: response regulator [Spirochaetaceae bacterium]|nr:response regulator [Spirochaetaceae bacterium]
MLLKKLLSQTKINIIVAKNGREAFELFRDNNDFDIIFMDLQMPIMDGYESSKLIRSLGTVKAKNVPIIAVSANAFEEDKNKIKASGMNENFQKPINIERLVTILDKYLGVEK